jgi:hypothetical protein
LPFCAEAGSGNVCVDQTAVPPRGNQRVGRHDRARGGAVLPDLDRRQPVRRAVERLSIAPAGGVLGALGQRAEVVGAAALQLSGAPLALASRLA